MEVFAANEQDIPLDETRLTSLARFTLESEEVEEGELSLLFVTADHIRRLNARFANNDYATDVLAFPMMEGDDEDEDDIGAETVLGDVVVCPSVAQENAEKVGHPLANELDLLVVHGTLHLLGYDHQNDIQKAAMQKRQGEILAGFRSN
jgi:probable rRNA maturation factor